MIAVLSASGGIGSAVASSLLALGRPVRVVGRHPDKLRRLTALGAEPHIGSLLDEDFLAEVFSGAKAAYVMIPADFGAPDYRASQNGIGEAIARALDRAGVPRAVNISSLGAHTGDDNGVVGGLHDQERRLNRLARTAVLHLRPAYFMENMLGALPSLRRTGTVALPLRPERAFPAVAVRDIADRVVKHLLLPEYDHGQTVDLLGPRAMSPQEMTVILGRAAGRPDAAYVQTGFDEFRAGLSHAGMSADGARSLTDYMRCLDDGRLCELAVRTAESTTPTTFEQLAEALVQRQTTN